MNTEKNKTRATIIIIAYNDETNIERAIQSACNQTERNIEIICVDDGSTDSTYERMRQWAARDDRIKAITQSNGGILAARFSGLQQVTSDYALFLDSDDTIMPEAVETACGTADETGADVLEFGVILVRDESNPPAPETWAFLEQYFSQKQPLPKTDHGSEVVKACFSEQAITWNTWNKCYRTELLRKALQFYQGERVCMEEDMLLTLMVLCQAGCYVRIPTKLYAYTVGSGMSTTAEKLISTEALKITATEGLILKLVREWINKLGCAQDEVMSGMAALIAIIRNCIINNMLSRIAEEKRGEYLELLSQYCERNEYFDLINEAISRQQGRIQQLEAQNGELTRQREEQQQALEQTIQEQQAHIEQLEEQNGSRLDQPAIVAGNIYFDYGEGYNQENSVSIAYDASKYVDFTTPIPEGTRTVRLDMVEGYFCVIKNLEVISDCGVLSYRNINGHLIERLDVFCTTDPQIDICLSPGVSWLRVRADVFVFSDPRLLSELQSVFLSEKIRFDDLSKTLAQTETERDDLRGALAQTETERDDLRRTLSQMETERDELRGVLAQTEAERDDLCGTLSQTETERDELRGVLAQTEAERDDLCGTLSQTETERDDLRGTLTQTETERDDLRRTLTQMETERDDLRGALTQTKAERDSLSDQLQKMTAQAEELNAQLLNVTNLFETISNSTCWKITKPVRVVLDTIKALPYKGKGYVFLAKKAAVIMRTQGIKAVLEKYRQRKRYLSQAYDLTERGGGTGNSFVDHAVEEQEPVIPQEWIDIQRKKPLISIIIAAKHQGARASYLKKALVSLCKQRYQNLEAILVADATDMPYVQELIRSFDGQIVLRSVMLECEAQNRWAYWSEGAATASGDLIGFLEQEDTLAPNCLAYVLEAYNESTIRKWKLYLIPDESQMKDDETLFMDRKSGAGFLCGGANGLLHFGVFEKTCFQSDRSAFEQWLLSLKPKQIFVAPWIGCREAAIEDLWGDNRVRCLAFYLPQFHEIPENNQWWGEGFTEWVNVRKAKPLYEGHHQPRIPGELGYYDLDGAEGAEIQKKQIALAKEYGLAGFCYYYYWFDSGKRLLEMPLDRHLHDKAMDFPFCLCWANENWTRQWDGHKSEILMPQTYQPGWAEQFILDLLPYLKDERYIRVNGAPFLLIYNLQDIPNPSESINTWRAVAEKTASRGCISRR